MKLETYKGIEFIRISAMPQEEQALIRNTFDKSRIVKILREHELLSDCVLASDYTEWVAATGKKVDHNVPATVKPAMSELRLAFK